MRNKYSGPCYQCGEVVAAGDGHFQRNVWGWLVHHAKCAIKFRNERIAGKKRRHEQQTKNNFKEGGPMATTQKGDSIKLTTPKFRVSFANVFKPRVAFDGQEPAYSLDALFDKKENKEMKWLKEAIKKAADSKWGAGKWPKNFKSPIKDGDEKELEGYPGNFFLTLKSKTKPGIVNRDLQEIIEPSEFYSGCFARATVIVKAYSTAGNNGVAVYLGNLQKDSDGDAFSGKKNAKDDFDALESLADDGEEQQESEFDF